MFESEFNNTLINIKQAPMNLETFKFKFEFNMKQVGIMRLLYFRDQR